MQQQQSSNNKNNSYDNHKNNRRVSRNVLNHCSCQRPQTEETTATTTERRRHRRYRRFHHRCCVLGGVRGRCQQTEIRFLFAGVCRRHFHREISARPSLRDRVYWILELAAAILRLPGTFQTHFWNHFAAQNR